jgi:hypothetical protein
MDIEIELEEELTPNGVTLLHESTLMNHYYYILTLSSSSTK